MIFSIVIPTYNRCELLKRAIDSVINQSLDDWELIIVDNYSTDNTKMLVKNYKNQKIKYFQVKNLGVIAKSRNLGIKKSKGEFIAFLDSDDWWYSNKLEVILKYITDYDFIYHDMDVYVDNKKTKEKLRVRNLKSPIFDDLMVNANAIINSSVVFRASLLEKVGLIDESNNLSSIEDYDFWIQISRKTNLFKLIPDALGGYQKHADNASNFSDASINKIDYLFEKNSKYLNKANRISAFLTKEYLKGRVYYELGLFDSAQSCFKKSVKSKIMEFKFKSMIMILMSQFKLLF